MATNGRDPSQLTTIQVTRDVRDRLGQLAVWGGRLADVVEEALELLEERKYGATEGDLERRGGGSHDRGQAGKRPAGKGARKVERAADRGAGKTNGRVRRTEGREAGPHGKSGS